MENTLSTYLVLDERILALRSYMVEVLRQINLMLSAGSVNSRSYHRLKQRYRLLSDSISQLKDRKIATTVRPW